MAYRLATQDLGQWLYLDRHDWLISRKDQALLFKTLAAAVKARDKLHRKMTKLGDKRELTIQEVGDK